jgi:hypothetical protein
MSEEHNADTSAQDATLVIEDSSTSQGDSPATGEDTTDSPKKSPLQKRIDKLTWEKSEAERRAAFYEGQLSADRAAQQPASKRTQSADDLDPDDFNTHGEYLKAYTKLVREEITSEVQKSQEEAQRVAEALELQKLYNKGDEKYDDFREVALNKMLPVSQTMFEAAKGENLHDILYALGSNPEEAQRINSLTPTQQIKEIAKIESRFTSRTPAKKTSSAPNPAEKKIKSGGAAPNKSESEMSRAELHAKWEKERRATLGVK